MALTNTLILEDDNQESRDKLTDLLQRKDALILVILGNGPSVKSVVENADVIASQIIAGIFRKVVWMQNPQMLPFLNGKVHDGPQYKFEDIDPAVHIGFSFSLNHLLSYLMAKFPLPDNIRINLAFLKAGESLNP